MISATDERRLSPSAVAVVLAVLGAGCDGDGPCVPAAVSVAPADARLTALGDEVQLEAAVTASDGEVCGGVEPQWSSTPASVCTVSNSGTVTAVGNGTCSVTAAVDGHSGSASVTVEQVGTQLTFRPEPQGGLAETALPACDICVQDANGSDAEVDNSTVVAVAIGANPSGGALSGTTPKTVAAGCTTFDDLQIDIEGAGYTLVGSAAGLAGIVSGNLDIGRVVDEVVVSCAATTLASLGETVMCAAEARSPSGRVIPDPDEAGEPLNPSWASVPTSLCTVDDAGLVTAVANGICTVTAMIDDVSGDIVLTVQQVPVRLAVGPPDVAVLAPGELRSFTVEVLDALGQPITSPTISSSCVDPGTATASGGDVNGVSEGVTDCTFTSGPAEDTARVAVVAQKGFAAIATTSADSYRTTALSGSTLDLELWMIRPTGGDGDLGSLQGELAWDPAVLSFASSVEVEGGWTWIPNETAVGTGRLAFAAFSAAGTAADFVVARVTFDVAGPSGSNSMIDLIVSLAGDALGSDITALMQPVDTRTHIE